jgi:hypothetical protein
MLILQASMSGRSMACQKWAIVQSELRTNIEGYIHREVGHRIPCRQILLSGVTFYAEITARY